MTDPALEHPASRARSQRVSAPASVAVTVTADGCLFICAGVLALIDVGFWSFLVPLVLMVLIFSIYGRRAARELGIRSRDEMPYGSLVALGISGGVIGVFATHLGSYAGLVFMTYVGIAHVGERIIWARFRASRQAAGH